MILSARHLHEGQRLPAYYGIAWANPCEMTWTAYPIPFNILARWARTVYYLLAAQSRRNAIATAYHEGFRAGYQRGGNHVRHDYALARKFFQAVAGLPEDDPFRRGLSAIIDDLRGRGELT